MHWWEPILVSIVIFIFVQFNVYALRRLFRRLGISDEEVVPKQAQANCRKKY